MAVHRVVCGSLVGLLLAGALACSGGGTDVTTGAGGALGGQGGLGGAGGVTDGGGGTTFTGGAGPCAPGDTVSCYTPDPATLGVGVCAPGERTCDDDGTFGACEGQIAPSQEVCNGLDDDCDGLVDDFEGEVTCGLGLCQVTAPACASCVPLPPAATEACDGLDDDCDGVIDNGCPCTGSQKQSCYGGPAGTLGVGQCIAGSQTCINGAWGGCFGAVYPVTETCDGFDNDCDGLIDEDCPCNDGDTQPCYGGPSGTMGVGECLGGAQSCNGGAWGSCEGDLPPAAETCNGLDDDCDGQVDEGNPGGGGFCSTGNLGVCNNGAEACQSGSIACVQIGQPGTETCNGLDDDCDGQVDENNPGGGFTCPTGQAGVCAVGTSTCVAGSLSCVPNVTPSSEMCNGLDDDCNGQTDEGNPGGGAACSTGQPGVCGPGTTTCSGGSLICTANTPASNEVCDSLDNDCDGLVDEGNPGGGAACSTGQSGVCGNGVTACSNGSIVCNQTQQASAEICNGLDDDCDGLIDENNPGGGQSCNTGQPGLCATGITACSGGFLVCNATNSPTNEVCNGLDDDCDGATDEGNPGGGGACNTGGQGVCSAGTLQCFGGSLLCSQNQQPSNEVCDGLDNDCDGLTDEGNPGGGQACSTGLPGACAAGTTVCSGGAIVCVANQSPSAEVCDGVDNDCDGAVDEGNPGGGVSCSTGQPGVCGPGTTVCSGGALSCSPNQSPSAETCDGLDNDCDGFVDDGNPGGGGACSTGQLGACGSGTLQCQGAQLVCLQTHVPVQEVCANGIDDDCDGATDESEDLDGDGWGHCDGDCCDSGFCSTTPHLINPGAFEVVGNGVNDDCDAATSDTVAAPLCSSSALFTNVTPNALAQAMDICQTTTANPPLPQKKWGLINASFRLANGNVPNGSQLNNMQSWQGAVLQNYGTGGVVPQLGSTMAGISTGRMRDANDPGFVAPNNGTTFGSNSQPPASYLSAHGGSLPASLGCSGSCAAGSGANDSINLRLQIRAPTNAQSFAYQLRFFTSEYWTWSCSAFNDFFLALLSSGAANLPADKNISFDNQGNPLSVNNGFFDICQAKGCYTCPQGFGALTGTGMELDDPYAGAGLQRTGGGTVWLTTTAPVVPGETMILELMVFDVSDNILDSLVLLDGFQWSLTPAAVGTVPSD
jgi:hypothetical protein